MKKKIVVLSGAGISAESGIKTFRDSGGLWEDYNIEDVATPSAWARDMDLVLEFYNQRRKQLTEVVPNAGHLALVEMEKYFDVQIVTQNVDDLHERAGSTHVLHLHGELRKARSERNPELIKVIDGWELKRGDTATDGHQLRPHIVWFGEAVPEMSNAERIVSSADIFIVAGTSLNVYPAAGLIHYAPRKAPKYLIDPHDIYVQNVNNLVVIKEKAGKGLPELLQILKEKYC